MGVSSRIRWVVGALLGVALIGLSACGGAGDTDPDEEGDAGVVSGAEFLGHQLRDLPADQAPTVELAVVPDEHGGWNLHLTTERFTFTPEQTNGPARAGQGHAHIYLDEMKYSRAYSPWFYLPADAVDSGEHTVLVTLNADDHTVWAVDHEPVTAAATIAGDGHGNDHGHATPSTPASPPADAHVFEFEITDGRASPPLERASVQHGETVRIVVTGDQPDEVHLHGYDLTTEVGPGRPGVIEFEAGQTGLFELETHETGLVLLQLQVQ
jgi:hypothetical protein